MLAVERTQYILEELKKNKVVEVSELSKVINVTEETIRRDLEKLDKKGMIRRVHGGAYLREGYGNETPVAVREKIYQQEKQAIARASMEFIQEFDSIILDCSTTARYIAKELKGLEKKVSVITNSMAVAKELIDASYIRLILLGGEYKPTTGSFCGEITVSSLNGYYADKAFISSAGISLEAGITDYTMEEAAVRSKMIKQAKTCYYVGDITKIGRSAIHIIGQLNDVDYLIVDQKIDKKSLELKNKLLEAKKEIIIAKEIS